MNTPTTTSKYAPPLVVRRLNPHITTLSTPFLVFNRMRFGARTTLIRLTPDPAHLAVISPIHLTADVESVVAATGIPKYLIAPNMEHYLYLREWKQRYPDALVIGPAELQKKRFSAPGQEMQFDVPIAKGATWVSEEFNKEFDIAFVGAHFNREIVLNHRATGTLVEGDLYFNLPATEQWSRSEGGAEEARLSVPTNIIGRVHAADGGSVLGRLKWWGFCGGKTKELREECRVVMGWEFDAIVPCHGGIVERGGKKELARVLGAYGV